MLRLCYICAAIWFCGLLAGIARGDTFNLTDGRTVSGTIVPNSANQTGLKIRTDDGKYEDVSWTSLSQDDLKKLAQNPKMAAFAQPLIVETPAQKAQKTQIDIKPVLRLERPSAHSLFGAMFSSPLGVFVMLLLYAANIYAAYEISIFRSRPRGLVCGTAAVLPVIAPVLFLALPPVAREATESATRVAADAQTFGVAAPPEPAEEDRTLNPMAGETAAPAGLKLARTETGHSAAELPPTQVFQRGAYMFNRRFFETKFSGFFGLARREADKDMVMLVKAARGEYAAERITRISAGEMHVQIRKDAATEEVMVPFSEIKEVQLKHKNA